MCLCSPSSSLLPLHLPKDISLTCLPCLGTFFSILKMPCKTAQRLADCFSKPLSLSLGWVRSLLFSGQSCWQCHLSATVSAKRSAYAHPCLCSDSETLLGSHLYYKKTSVSRKLWLSIQWARGESGKIYLAAHIFHFSFIQSKLQCGQYFYWDDFPWLKNKTNIHARCRKKIAKSAGGQVLHIQGEYCCQWKGGCFWLATIRSHTHGW